MNAKAKGSRAEHRTMRLLARLGYRCTRSGASLGAWDVIGIGHDDVIVCQVKVNRWPSLAEMARLRAFAVPPGVRRVIHRWRDRQPAPDVRDLRA